MSTSDRIIIVCKNSEETVINTLLTQIGWRSRIQAVITIDELVTWYDKALKGTFLNILGKRIISTLANEIKTEFPSVGSNDF
ncbi:MAG: HaeII family restriction endonuclease [Candidatus Electrothrix sp. AW1]|nr:HaeII family restriction endonuclease [Candidatus Electrothrix sp. AX1]MCI5181089.1 HaeII family restriction endonuclease [Candidatus Electrothrix gigas]